MHARQFYSATKNESTGDREPAYQLRVLVTLPEDPSSVPKTHIRDATVACISSSRRSDPLFSTPLAPILICAQTATHTHHTHIHVIKNKINLFYKSKVYISKSETHKHQAIHVAASYNQRFSPF